ncbi:DUF503 domain-containing protein [Aeromicrobium duanguangcaii]|uniref:DUF503 family protein n=1 Tax=Aeromicrobium duanguangcaii TaxID=2968086 RepID=A0ABY5KJY4_9ACTN|nr:DUF503 family protein [Aeromicrobium duanguangcaii]MCD9153607.1 DUF503 family protein [Aeromicrobium duanguangcaii]MCL3836408.1 DUF503 family protein [Aeromicrobium duanguangcaii]UUI69310.1 DUF503 family protein [Aeromicrobium duanguangcaii]
MWVGWIEFDLRLGDVHSLKEKRAIVRPVVNELRRRFSLSAAETDSVDLYRRAGIGGSLVSIDRAHVVEVLDAVERWMAERPEIEILEAHRHLTTSADDEDDQGELPFA